jgi:hypothetical protein
MKIDGFEVKNATRRQRLEITDNDVKTSDRKQPNSCAAAKACLRIPGIQKARIHISTAYLFNGKLWKRYRTPAAIGREIISFDRGANFTAGDYELRPLQPSHRARGKRMGGINRKKKITNRNVKKIHVVKDIREAAKHA